MTPYKDAMLCHLHRLAKATTSQQFEKRLSDLKRSDVWTDSYGKVFKTWFENTWLAVKEVNFFVNFSDREALSFTKLFYHLFFSVGPGVLKKRVTQAFSQQTTHLRLRKKIFLTNNLLAIPTSLLRR
jgi:hypothetical protein